MKTTFKKEERLTSKTVIKELFTKSSSFALYPFKVLYNAEVIEQDLNAKVIFTVPKRAFKKAVDRNFIRRRMKESYRLFKNDFYPQLPNLKLSLCIIYIAKEKNEFQFIDKKMKLALQKLADELNR